MAANDPSYFKSTPVQQVVQQKELRFHLYVFQHHVEGSDGQNQRTITDLKLPNYFGLGYVNDWIIRDGPSASANIVARAEGLHLGAGMDEDNWFICFNLIFTDERFKGSCLQVLGNLRGRDGEWAVMGGTGEFAFAQGVATFKEFGDISRIAIRELHIHVMCLGFPEPVKYIPCLLLL